MTIPPAAAVPAYGRPPVRTWDLVLSIVLMVLSVGLGLVLLVMAPFLVMASDPCGAAVECNTEQMGLGFLVALIGPGFAIAAGIVVGIVLLVLRRLAFWVPLVGSVLAAVIFVIGAGIVIGGVPGATF
jgi:uncharacterized BrkB/YihY/UPF0761 family membrane protein